MTTSVNTLKERIHLFVLEKQKDGFGGEDRHWKLQRHVWAQVKVTSLQGVPRQKSQGQSINALPGREQTIEVKVRAGIPLSQNMRLEWEKNIYGMVTDPYRTEDRRFQIIYATQIAGEASKP